MDDIVKIKKLVSQLTHQKHTSLHCSGTDALYEILKSLKLQRADTVLVPAFSCERILLPFLKLNINVALVDTSPSSVVPSLTEYKKSMTQSVKALLLIYPWGYLPDDLFQIIDWAKQNDIIIIEDIASALGLSYKTTILGTLGQYCFGSFGHDKFSAIGEIGFSNLTDKDSMKIGDKVKLTKFLDYNMLIKLLRNKLFKFFRPFLLKILSKFPEYSFSGKVSSTNFPSLIKNLDFYSDELDKRKSLTDFYLSAIKNTPQVKILTPNNDQSVALRVACFFNSSLTRDNALTQANKKKLWLGRDYLVPLQEWLRSPLGEFKNTNQAKDHIVNLVTNPNNLHGKKVIDMIKYFYI
jgi:dTDP-4-amino-4,6-dideoxygalactose transaminase